MAEGEQDFFVFDTGPERNACAAAKRPGKHVYVRQFRQQYVWATRSDGSWGWVEVGSTYPSIPYSDNPGGTTPPQPEPPQPEPEPPPAKEQNKYKNPFNAASYTRIPMGTKARKGVSAGTNKTTAAIPGSNGTFDRVGKIKLSVEKMFLKYCDELDIAWKSYEVRWNNSGNSSGNKLPFTLKLPEYIKGIFNQEGKDSNYMVYDAATDTNTMFYGMYWNAAGGYFTARYRKTWGFGGVDHSCDGQNGDSGSGAGKLKHVAGSYNFQEARDALPILHALQCTLTYAHSSNSDKSSHVLGDSMCRPAAGKDGTSGNNGGNIPYGSRFAIIGGNISKAMALTMSPRGSRLRDCLIDYGIIAIDGTGEKSGVAGKPGLMQIRCRNSDVTPHGKWLGAWPDDIRNDIESAFAQLLPFLDCVENGEPVDGVIGGGTPVRPSAVNAAYNA